MSIFFTVINSVYFLCYSFFITKRIPGADNAFWLVPLVISYFPCHFPPYFSLFYSLFSLHLIIYLFVGCRDLLDSRWYWVLMSYCTSLLLFGCYLFYFPLMLMYLLPLCCCLHFLWFSVFRHLEQCLITRYSCWF